jgi:hypothetical protein
MSAHSGARGLAIQMLPFASSVIPSGTRANVGAHTRRFKSAPPAPRSKAVKTAASVSPTISVFPSGVMTEPLGKCISLAATLTSPFGDT